MVKLQESKGRYWVSIPLSKVKAARLEKGTEFDVSFTKEGDILFRRIDQS